MPKLYNLVLGDNGNIGNEGGLILASALHQLPSLKFLNLENTGIKAEAARAIAFALIPMINQIKIINISNNRQLDTNSIFSMAWLFEKKIVV